MGKFLPKIPPEENQNVVDYYNNCKSVKKTAEKYNVTGGAIGRILKLFDIHPREDNKKIPTADHQKIVDWYKTREKKITEISSFYKVNPAEIYRILRKYDEQPHYDTCKLSEQDKMEIIQKYKERPGFISEIAKEYKVDNRSIINVLRKNNIKIINKWDWYSESYDYSFFENGIDSSEKAYILGLWYADGYTNYKTSCIALVEQDRRILQKISETLKTKNPPFFIGKRKSTHSNYYRLEINSQKLYNDFVKLGCVSKKSLILKWPSFEMVPEKFIWHFIRGVFDGDGCISVMSGENRWGRLEFSITGAPDFIRGLNNFLLSNNFHTRFKIKKDTIAIGVAMSRQRELKVLYKLLYKDCGDFYIDRKKNKFDYWNDTYKVKKNCL